MNDLRIINNAIYTIRMEGQYLEEYFHEQLEAEDEEEIINSLFSVKDAVSILENYIKERKTI